MAEPGDTRERPTPLPGAPEVPLDHPGAHRPHRLYVALTTHCNRACPWCSTSSSPAGRTFLSHDAFVALLPEDRDFELQLEGGEPLVHPEFWALWAHARAHPRCRKMVLCTNGASMPRRRLGAFLDRLGAPTLIKLSWNHHLRDHDPGLLALAGALAREARARPGLDLVVNVRLRPAGDGPLASADGDADVRAAIAEADLADVANVFFLERYGLAAGETGWELPRAVWGDFTLANPDGRTWGTDLLARSEAMAALP